jgi:hypothetical protein
LVRQWPSYAAFTLSFAFIPNYAIRVHCFAPVSLDCNGLK